MVARAPSTRARRAIVRDIKATSVECWFLPVIRGEPQRLGSWLACAIWTQCLLRQVRLYWLIIACESMTQSRMRCRAVLLTRGVDTSTAYG